ncbi:hypothetical protein Ae201684P_019600 [Aphanomyces euteiches]|nr:hypothetical protein Ae201684P_019600 [Aphanomyces euteiches]
MIVELCSTTLVRTSTPMDAAISDAMIASQNVLAHDELCALSFERVAALDLVDNVFFSQVFQEVKSQPYVLCSAVICCGFCHLHCTWIVHLHHDRHTRFFAVSAAAMYSTSLLRPSL